MATFFTRAVESLNELRISLRRLEEFLSLPEPPVPVHVQPIELAAAGATFAPKSAESPGKDTHAADLQISEVTTLGRDPPYQIHGKLSQLSTLLGRRQCWAA